MISAIEKIICRLVARWSSTPFKSRAQVQFRIIAEFVRGAHPRPKPTGVQKVLTRRPLVSVPLPVADCGVIVGCIARDMIPYFIHSYAAPRPTDDDGDLAS